MPAGEPPEGELIQTSKALLKAGKGRAPGGAQLAQRRGRALEQVRARVADEDLR